MIVNNLQRDFLVSFFYFVQCKNTIGPDELIQKLLLTKIIVDFLDNSCFVLGVVLVIGIMLLTLWGWGGRMKGLVSNHIRTVIKRIQEASITLINIQEASITFNKHRPGGQILQKVSKTQNRKIFFAQKSGKYTK